MSVGIVDTTVILHYFRHYGDARVWVDFPTAASVYRLDYMDGGHGGCGE